MGMIIRVEGLTNNATKIHIFGPNSHKSLQLTPDGNDLELIKEANTPYTVIHAKGTRDNKFYVVKQGSNDLEIVDLDSKKKMFEYKGYPEETYGKPL